MVQTSQSVMAFKQSEGMISFVCKLETFLYLQTCRMWSLISAIFCVNYIKKTNSVCKVSSHIGTVLQRFERQETNAVLEKSLNSIEGR